MQSSLGRAIKSCPPLVTLHYIYPRSPTTCSCNCRSDGVQCMQSLIDAMITDQLGISEPQLIKKLK